MYKHTLRAADQYFGKGVAVPANASGALPTALRVGGHLGSLAAEVCVAGTPLTLAAGKQLAVQIEEADSQSGPFTLRPESYAVTFAAAATLNSGDIPLSVVLPDCKPWVRLCLCTDDAAAAGTVDVYLKYLPR